MVRKSLTRIVIIGAGFGGIQTALHLKNVDAQIIVIDRSNHHLFQPLLYQVATAGLSPGDIAIPIRRILRAQKNTEVIMAEVSGIDKQTKEIMTDSGAIPYDYLIIATGAVNSYFGNDGWAEYAPGLKTIEDARLIRGKILSAFELAEIEQDVEKKKSLLSFVIIGGGPTGVEMAGSIAELSHYVLRDEFRHIDPREARIILIEAGTRILANFPEDLSKNATQELQALGVEILTGIPVANIDSTGVRLGNELIASHTIIWAAGVQASPAASWLGAEHDRSGRVKVGADLILPGFENIFVIGDAAFSIGDDGKPLPGLSPVAMQQGRYVAKLLKRKLTGESKFKPFRYLDKGSMATIGRSRAVAVFKGLRLTGFVAWLIWLFVHIFYLIGFRNRFIVMFEWAYAYITYQRGVRIISSKKEEG